MVAWRESYLDLILIPLGLLLPALYHAWLWRAVRRRPLSTAFGVYSAARRLWAAGMMRDNDDKKGVLVVQSLRNVIMGSTLMATTSVLFCTGIAAVLSSTYSVKKPLSDAVFGAHGEYMMALNFLINTSCLPLPDAGKDDDGARLVGLQLPAGAVGDYVGEILERSFTLNFIGNRLFYAGVPLLLWIFGPVLAFLSAVVMIPILYNLDMVNVAADRGTKEHSSGCVNGKANGNGCMQV
ncbi:uncharacterized protein LOC119310902 isoform X2 [Triticum dicoccoides]|uniref:Uncharacterized protein n=1 Tax=Triticum turgidum subsp. durum TaxID=4567 RepID=A0A9R0XCG9_TRITD|nr:uncharacterized protein LOC119310902 isoform X2 [Triticum dicoccoides]XP_044389396.1 uncharacterized protein LOC123112474 isoform X2 [Triticum aestivum]VAI33989.1 unnamed protein product [Triticum turgidum subsp. durum]